MKFYTKLIIIFCILFSVSIGQTEKPKHYRVIGFLDHKTGLSLLGYARTLIIHNNNELFVGIGTLIAANTISLGWKYSFLNKPVKLNPDTGDPIIGFSTGLIDDYYVVASIQSVAGMGGSIVAPFFSGGFEKRLTKKIYINVGVNSMFRYYGSKSVDNKTGEVRPALEFITFPTIHFSLRY